MANKIIKKQNLFTNLLQQTLSTVQLFFMLL